MELNDEIIIYSFILKNNKLGEIDISVSEEDIENHYARFESLYGEPRKTSYYRAISGTPEEVLDGDACFWKTESAYIIIYNRSVIYKSLY